MLEYLSDAIPRVEGLFPGCGRIITGDFKQLDTKHLCWDFYPKQLVHQPTCGANILDLVLTNMYNFYDSKPAVLLPPFGLSDYNAVAVWLKTRVSTPTPSRKIVIKRDIHPSHKMKLGQYLSEIDWYLIKSEFLCNQKCKFLCSAIMTGYNILMLEKQVKIHQNDTPWISWENKVNRMRKSCQGKYFASKAIKL